MNFIEDWFDPKNIEHIEAYVYLETFGIWPENFIPEDVCMTTLWHISLSNKMADCWLEHMIQKRIDKELEK